MFMASYWQKPIIKFGWKSHFSLQKLEKLLLTQKNFAYTKDCRVIDYIQNSQGLDAYLSS